MLFYIDVKPVFYHLQALAPIYLFCHLLQV